MIIVLRSSLRIQNCAYFFFRLLQVYLLLTRDKNENNGTDTDAYYEVVAGI